MILDIQCNVIAMNMFVICEYDFDYTDYVYGLECNYDYVLSMIMTVNVTVSIKHTVVTVTQYS